MENLQIIIDQVGSIDELKSIHQHVLETQKKLTLSKEDMEIREILDNLKFMIQDKVSLLLSNQIIQ